MKRIVETLKELWHGSMSKSEPAAKIYTPKIEFCKEQAAINIEKLRSSFENKQAIYVEKGALLVRVTDITVSMSSCHIMAQAQEVKTPGLGVGMFAQTLKSKRPLSWQFGGCITEFAQNFWAMGYGGWLLFSEPNLVAEVARLAGSFPPELDDWQRYKQVTDIVHDQLLTKMNGVQRVFPPVAGSDNTAGVV